MEKKNIGMKIIFVILCLVVITFSGYIVYDVISSNNNNITDKNESTSWTDYLLSLDILDAKIYRLRSKDLGDSEDFNKTVNLSLDQLKDLILKIEKTSSLQKHYSLGMGGPQKDKLTISYEYNNKTYEFKIVNGIILVDTLDSNFINLLNQGNYEEFGTENKNQEGSFYYYDLNGFEVSLLDNYFK